jgi:signal peptidase I
MPKTEETTAERHQPQATPSISLADEPLPEATPTAAPSQGTSAAEVLRELVETIILTLAIFLLIRNFAQNFRVEGSSMEPNLHDRQFLIVNRFAYCPGFHLDVDILGIHWQKVWCIWQPKRGDIIVFHAPDQPKDYIKRVIGLPGEKIQIDAPQCARRSRCDLGAKSTLRDGRQSAQFQGFPLLGSSFHRRRRGEVIAMLLAATALGYCAPLHLP